MACFSGRRLILDSLRDKEEDKKQIVRDFFLLNDYIPRSVYSLSRDEHTRLKSKSANLAQNIEDVTDVFKRFSADLRHTIMIKTLGDWDPEILADAQELLCHQDDVFSEISDNLRNCLTVLKKNSKNITERLVLDTKIEDLETAKNDAKVDLEIFMEKFQDNNAKTGLKTDWNTVPASTFRELLVQNAFKQLAHEIFKAIKDSRGDMQMALKNATAKILEPGSNMLKKFRGFDPTDNTPWCSQTIAVIADPYQEILLIGGTKPNASPKSFMALSRMSKAISTERLGARFSQIINLNTEDFWKMNKDKKSQDGTLLNAKVVGALEDSEVDTLYEDVIVTKAPSKQSWGDLMSHPENPLFLWAFNGGSFELVPPCLRCQWLYYSWNVAEKPSNTSGKRESL